MRLSVFESKHFFFLALSFSKIAKPLEKSKLKKASLKSLTSPLSYSLSLRRISFFFLFLLLCGVERRGTKVYGDYGCWWRLGGGVRWMERSEGMRKRWAMVQRDDQGSVSCCVSPPTWRFWWSEQRVMRFCWCLFDEDEKNDWMEFKVVEGETMEVLYFGCWWRRVKVAREMMSNKNDYGSLKVVRDGKRFSCVGFFIQRVKSLCCYVGEEVMLCVLLIMVNEVESRRKPRWKKKLKKIYLVSSRVSWRVEVTNGGSIFSQFLIFFYLYSIFLF